MSLARKIKDHSQAIYRTKSGLHFALLSAAICFGIVGSIILSTSHAATPVANVQSEAGIVNSNAVKITDSSAANSTAVKFRSGSSIFLTRQGTTLLLNGATYKFAGVNAYGLATCEDGAGYYTTADLNSFFQSLPPHDLTRMWATSAVNLSDLDRVVAAAVANNQMLIVSLVDGANNCNLNNKQLDRSWYQTGYKSDYLPWIQTIVPRYAASPAIGMWEVANEPGWGCTGGGDCGVTPAEMKSFLDTSAAAIKAADPNHLVESGAMGMTINAMYPSSNFALTQSGPNIDVTSVHEYEYDYNGNTAKGGSFDDIKAASAGLNKPILVGETGALLNLPNNTTCANSNETVQALAKSKFDSYFASGASGVLMWNWMKQQPSWTGSGCGAGQDFFFGTNNPVLTLLRTYTP